MKIQISKLNRVKIADLLKALDWTVNNYASHPLPAQRRLLLEEGIRLGVFTLNGDIVTLTLLGKINMASNNEELSAALDSAAPRQENGELPSLVRQLGNAMWYQYGDGSLADHKAGCILYAKRLGFISVEHGTRSNHF